MSIFTRRDLERASADLANVQDAGCSTLGVEASEIEGASYSYVNVCQDCGSTYSTTIPQTSLCWPCVQAAGMEAGR